jgi:hypothetical protein
MPQVAQVQPAWVLRGYASSGIRRCSESTAAAHCTHDADAVREDAVGRVDAAIGGAGKVGPVGDNGSAAKVGAAASLKRIPPHE